MRRFLLALTVVIIFPASLFALTVLRLNVQQLTELADRVFIGKCVSVRSESDSAGRPVQYVTYQVEDMIKGPPSDRVTFKQLGATEEQMQRQDGNLTIVGVFRELPHYQVGEESIVFLSEEGNLGLTAPVGLQQGKFVVKADASGRKMVVNGANNLGLFMGLNQSPKVKAMSLPTTEKNLLKQNGGEIVYDDFVSLVKRLATP